VKVESCNQVFYGGIEDKDGKMLPVINMGIKIDGEEIVFIGNVSFSDNQTLADFLLMVHNTLSSQESKKANYDSRGELKMNQKYHTVLDKDERKQS